LLGAAALTGGAARPAAAAGGAFPQDTVDQIDAAVKSGLSTFKAPGAVVGLWMPGQGSYVKAYGFSDPVKQTPMTVDDHVRIGSITKTFTVTVLLQLVQNKTVKLTDPIGKYLPFVPRGGDMTLRMLANMTSGIASYTFDDAFIKDVYTKPDTQFTPRQLVDIAFKMKRDFEPGKGWNYCNTNTVLLGMMIEKVTQKPIADVFSSMIFKKLNLTQTSWPTTGALPAPYAHGITEYDGKQLDPTNWNPSWGFTAGQLISNLADLRTWVKAYTTGSLISPELQKERTTWVTLPPNSPKRAYGLGIGIDNGWLGHTGELPGYNTAGYYLPAKDAVFVVEVNSDIAGPDKANPAPAIFKSLTKILTPGNLPA
jgi:D-alanyl-D-alanine carboxypeptidase